MMYLRRKTLLSCLVLLAFLAGCNMPGLLSQPGPPVDDPIITTPLPPLSETLVSFRVEVPANTPAEGVVYLNVLDEVTGLALNAHLNPMQAVEPSAQVTGTQTSHQYAITLPFAIGSVIKYRYEREVGALRVAEHLSDGGPVRYRLYYVQGQSSVEDVVSRWTDTPFEAPTGRITGQALDSSNDQPIPNLLICAGGVQTITASDGSFRLEGLPPGVHNLVGYAMDGAYHPFQQGARVAAESTTPAPIKLPPAALTKIVFVVRVPKDTPPVVPLRLAGNLYQLGNTFGNLAGGMSSLATNMPLLERLPDGRYKVTLSLPVGADLRYKYTLGDGFWNAEHTPDGNFRLRQIVVPDQTVLIEDTVDTWYAGTKNSLTFDLRVPAETPPEDFVAIQFDPLFGWTVPIPMWRLGGERWAYVLYSPLNLPGNFSYRYCRNGQCGVADDAQTPGLYGAGRQIQIGTEPIIQSDQVLAWANWSGNVSAEFPEVSTAARGPEFWVGVEFLADYHPSWKSLLPLALDDSHRFGSNWLVLSPTWTFVRGAEGTPLPVLQLVPGQDALWFDLVDAIQQAQDGELNVALHPAASFPIPAEQWWAGAARDAAWWQVWFEQYSHFILHHADLAERTGAAALVLGGDWLVPALPDGTLADGTPSGVPSDAEARWRSLIGEVRQRYGGQLAWALPHQAIESPPTFLDAVDLVYLELSLTPGLSIEDELGADINTWLDYTVWPFQILAGKDVILAAEYPSDPDLQAQVDAYHALLSAASQRDWIVGFISRGYYPPAALQDLSPSVHGKPASDLLGLWFPQLLGPSIP